MHSHRWRLDGQLALVTGGSAGIGRAIVRELLGLGAQVLACARDADGLDTLRAECEEEFADAALRTFAADVGDEDQRSALLDWVEDCGDGLNILVNNAGGNITKSATEYGEDELRAWAARVRAEPWQEAYVFLKHDEESAAGPDAAVRLAGIVAGSNLSP